MLTILASDPGDKRCRHKAASLVARSRCDRTSVESDVHPHASAASYAARAVELVDSTSDTPASERQRLGPRSGLILAGQMLIVAGLLSWLALSAPLTYDEAYNWITYRTDGWFSIATNYDVPNNHVPYTLLQMLIPGRLVTWNPWMIRIIAVSISIVLLTILSAVSLRRTRNPLLALMIVWGSPLLTSFRAGRTTRRRLVFGRISHDRRALGPARRSPGRHDAGDAARPRLGERPAGRLREFRCTCVSARG
jgi:hypothetical protein